MTSRRETVDCRSKMASNKFLGMKDVKSCVSSAYGRFEMVEVLIRELRVAV